MAAVTAAAVAAAGTAYAANKQAGAAKDAARAGQNGAQAGLDYQRERDAVFDQNISPYLGLGQSGVSQLQALLAGDMSGFKADPGYQFRFDESLKGLDRSAASRGGLFSGGHQADVIDRVSGMASQEYGNYWNRLMGVAGMGQNAAVGAGNLGQQSANNASNLYGQMGQAQANGAIGSANAWSNAASGLAGIAGSYFGNRGSSYQQPQSGGQWGAFTPQGQNNGGLGSGWGQGWGG